MKKPVVIGLAVVVLAAVVAGGYWWYQSRQDNGLTLYGNVDIRTVNLSFRVGGRVESLAVDEGDAIKAGQVLGELDHKPYEIALMQAKAGVSVAQAQYDLMLAGYRNEEIAQAAAAVKQAQAAYDYAQNFYNRQQGLWKSRTISANDLENARSSRDQAQATLKSAQDKLRQYRSGNREQDIAQAKASLEQAQAQLAQAELNLQDSTLIAPSDGTLLTRAVEPGTVLNEGGTVFTVSLTHHDFTAGYGFDRQDRDSDSLVRCGCALMLMNVILTRPSRGAKCCFIPMVARTSRITGRLVSFRRLLNLPRKPSKRRICVPTSSIACVLW